MAEWRLNASNARQSSASEISGHPKGPRQHGLEQRFRQLLKELKPARGCHELITRNRCHAVARDHGRIREQREAARDSERDEEPPNVRAFAGNQRRQREPDGHRAERIQHHRNRPQPQRRDDGKRNPEMRRCAGQQSNRHQHQQQEREHHERIAPRIRGVQHESPRRGDDGSREQCGPGAIDGARDHVGRGDNEHARDERRQSERPWQVPEHRHGRLGQQRMEEMIVRVGVRGEGFRPRQAHEIHVRNGLVVAHRLPEIQRSHRDGDRHEPDEGELMLARLTTPSVAKLVEKDQSGSRERGATKRGGSRRARLHTIW